MSEPLAALGTTRDPAGDLEVRRLAAGYGDRTVLAGVSMRVPASGVYGLLGPAGAGKSTLLRTLSRWNDALPSFWRHGEARLDGRDLLALPDPEVARQRLALLLQRGRLYTASLLDNAIAEVRPQRPLGLGEKRRLAREVLEPWGLWSEMTPHLDSPVVSLTIGQQRRVALARLVAGRPRFLLVDEPLRDLPDGERERVAVLLLAIADRLPILLCTHDQGFARRFCDHVCLFAAGRAIETGPAEEFFRLPSTPEGRDFIRFGNCWPKAYPTGEAPNPEPGAADEEPNGAAAAVAPPFAAARPARRRPAEFHWVVPGHLGGCQQPGLLGDLEAELAGLAESGCTLLVSLRQCEPPSERIGAHGMDLIHFPIVDMEVPQPAAALALCERLWQRIDGGDVVVLHCKAGLGRTGTLLACLLVYRGVHAVRAVERVRTVNPRYIQSDAQLAFVESFSHTVCH